MAEQQFEIRPLRDGKPSADALFYGSLPQVMECIPQSVARNEAMQRLATAQEAAQLQDETRASALRTITDSLGKIMAHAETLASLRADEARRKARADAEREAKLEATRIKAWEDSLPDVDDPGDDAPTHSPSGELHSVAPAQTRSEDVLGDLPKELAPPASGPFTDPDPKDLAYPKTPKYRQPVVIGGP
jgi:septal ring factor EnvC (AmiA/AmiB activator)